MATCLICGTEFRDRGIKRFCSRKCKMTHRIVRNRPPRSVLNCLLCGAEFLAFGRKRFCSSDCRNKDYRLRHRVIGDHPCTVCGVLIGGHRSIKRCPICEQENTRERHRRYYANSIKCQERNRLKRARQRSLGRSLISDLTVEQWQYALAWFDNCCVYCGRELDIPHKDHFVPMGRGGGLTRGNIVPSCHSCNERKGGKMPLDWLVMQEHGLVKFVKITKYLESVVSA